MVRAPQRMSRRKLAGRAALVLLGFLGLATLAVGAFALWLSNTDLKPILERQASNGLQRRVTIGAFKVGWGDPLAIDFSDLRIANASWGSNVGLDLGVGARVHDSIKRQRTRHRPPHLRPRQILAEAGIRTRPSSAPSPPSCAKSSSAAVRGRPALGPRLYPMPGAGPLHIDAERAAATG